MAEWRGQRGRERERGREGESETTKEGHRDIDREGKSWMGKGRIRCETGM